MCPDKDGPAQAIKGVQKNIFQVMRVVRNMLLKEILAKGGPSKEAMAKRVLASVHDPDQVGPRKKAG